MMKLIFSIKAAGQLIALLGTFLKSVGGALANPFGLPPPTSDDLDRPGTGSSRPKGSENEKPDEVQGSFDFEGDNEVIAPERPRVPDEIQNRKDFDR